MKKLTKEQYEYVLEQIEHDSNSTITAVNDVDDGARVYVQIMSRLKESLNKCTEKEFPEFLDEWGDGMTKLSLTNANTSFLPVKLALCDQSGEASIMLTAAELKRFVEGCNKIVEYLEEQE